MATVELRDEVEATKSTGPPDLLEEEEKEKILGAREALIATTLTEILAPYIRANRLGRAVSEGLFRLDPTMKEARQPDFAFVSNERWPADRPVPAGATFSIVPDLAVEVVSPTDRAIDVFAKVDEYFAHGVRQVWTIYQASGAVVVHEPDGTTRTTRRGGLVEPGPMLPGFRLSLDELFADIPTGEVAG